MPIVPFLIVFPLIVSVLMFVIRVNKVRNFFAYISAVIIMVSAGALTVQWGMQGFAPMLLTYNAEVVDHVILAAEIILMILVTVLSFKYKKYWVSLLSILPTALIAYFELLGPALPEGGQIYVDHLSILMCLIVGVIGGLIVVYAVGYMHGYHHHHTEFEDRRYYFFALLFAFLGAMFGFVLSENLLWIDFFWEMTSICSFLLIGYTKTPEAINNCFRALWMNLLGGCALAVGIVYYGYNAGVVSLHGLVEMAQNGDKLAVIPVALIAFAALTKAAQLPFSTWLIGAMVAPTPSSALLHSATMVKAGIYVLFRLAPAMTGTTTGMMIALIGGFTFLVTSIMAIAQSDGKKVLAFSTISNLGLMVACAGVGTEETIWAGVFLMMFHAISKSLLFQDVGATENALHSRDIEDMHGLLYILPRLAIFMFIGIAGMFLAPFGMLISKWAALKASIDERNIILVFFICFGSATTSFYWTKWMGKIISASHLREKTFKDITKKNEVISLTIHAIMMIVLCVSFPWISKVYVTPLITEMFGVGENVLPDAILYTLIVVIVLVFAVPFFAYLYSKHAKVNMKLSYMNGINTGDNRKFVDAMGEEKTLWLSNYYMHKVIGSRKLMVPSQIFTVAVLLIMLSMIIGGVLV
ncbi:MAG: NADH-quinone oxidoreductase subunit L [Lachnospiraceae bacterium]|nr:NADH-quinone oxidoreductase subunit L [Lachnospiraceae bacterium]